MAKGSQYFSHDYNARHDRKTSALVADYKAAGYGIFWATCEMMHEEGDRLQFDEMTLGAIAKDLNEELQLVEKVINDCVSKYKLFKHEALLEANEAEEKVLRLLRSNRVTKNLNRSLLHKIKKSEAGKIGGLKSGESRRNKAKINDIPKKNEAVLEANERNEAKKSKVNINIVNTKKEESKKEESKTPANGVLKNSNLFREPNVPKFEDVLRCFLGNGGTEEMANRFFNKNEGLGWYLSGSPITNFSNLIPSYIQNWQKNERAKSNSAAGGRNTASLELLEDIKRNAGRQ